MGKYSYLKDSFNSAESAQVYDQLPEGRHTACIDSAEVVDSLKGQYVRWTLSARVDDEVMNASFLNYMTDKGFPFLKANLRALLGKLYEDFDLDDLDDWLDWVTHAIVTVDVKHNTSLDRTYVNYAIRGLVEPITAPPPQPGASQQFTPVDDDKLPF